jgi:hypothetical protein
MGYFRASRFRTVLSCQAPPRAVRMPRALRAAAIARPVVAPLACICRTIGSTRGGPGGLRVGEVRPVPQDRALRLFRGQCGAGPIGNQVALFLGQSGIDVQHERIGVGAKFRNDERDPLGHQTTDESHVAGQAAELGYHNRRLGLPGGSQGGGKLGAPFDGVGTLAGFHFDVFANDLASLGSGEAGNRFALGFDAQAGLALLAR